MDLGAGGAQFGPKPPFLPPDDCFASATYPVTKSM